MSGRYAPAGCAAVLAATLGATTALAAASGSATPAPPAA